MPGTNKPRKKLSSTKTAWVDVEADPTGRFTRSNQVLGRGASKVVYKGFDRHQGIEVAWNQVKIVEHLTPKEHARLESEVSVLRRLKHKNIMSFYASWIDEQQHTLNFVTEYFHPGPLRRHRRNHKHLSRRVLKRWAWQILEGLIYLHGHVPPIIHRDLKCDNIFIHGTSGVVKIGDLGLAKLMEEGLSSCQSVLGTPEFMAPELYREQYNEKVDIYSFGMCLLELVTMEFPYRECKNKAQIFRQVTLGVYPAALGRIEDAETRSFIELCIDHFHEKRPMARQLIKHPFFDDVRPQRPNSPFTPFGLGSDSGRDSVEGDGPHILLSGAKPTRPELPLRPPSAPLPRSAPGLVMKSGPITADMSRMPSSPLLSDHRPGEVHSEFMKRQVSTPLPLERTFSVQQRGVEGSTLDFELCMMRKEGTDFRRFKFTFDVETDTVQAVTEEFEEEFGLTPTETDQFMDLLKEELERMPQKERFVPMELSGIDSSKISPELQVKLRQQDGHPASGNMYYSNESADGQMNRSAKFISRTSPRVKQSREEHFVNGETFGASPRASDRRSGPQSSHGYGQVEPDGIDVRPSPREAGVVLMRVSGENVRAYPRSRRQPDRRLQSQPVSQFETREGVDSGKDFPLSLKAYHGGEDDGAVSTSRMTGYGQSPRAVSSGPRDHQMGSPNGRGPQPQVQQGQNRHSQPYGEHRPSPDFNSTSAYQQNWGYNNRSPEAPAQAYQPSTPPSQSQWSKSRQDVSSSGYTSAPEQQYGVPKAQPQERWVEPGFHMPKCGPFPIPFQKIRSLFSDRQSKGARYESARIRKIRSGF